MTWYVWETLQRGADNGLAGDDLATFAAMEHWDVEQMRLGAGPGGWYCQPLTGETLADVAKAIRAANPGYFVG